MRPSLTEAVRSQVEQIPDDENNRIIKRRKMLINQGFSSVLSLKIRSFTKNLLKVTDREL